MDELKNIVEELTSEKFKNEELRSLVLALSYECDWDLATELISSERYRHNDFYSKLLEKVNNITSENRDRINIIASYVNSAQKAKLDEIIPL